MSSKITLDTEADYFYKQGVQAVFNKNYDAAEFFLLKSLEIENSDVVYACLGWLYGTLLGSEEKGLGFFRKAILRNPENGDLYNDYGALLLKMGRFEESLKWFSRAVRLANSKKKHFALYNLALVYHNWKRSRSSLRYLRLALKYEPSFQEARQLYYSILENAHESPSS